MKLFVRAVVTGFALSLGTAIFKKIAPQLGLDDKDKDKQKANKADNEIAMEDGASDPGLQHEFS